MSKLYTLNTGEFEEKLTIEEIAKLIGISKDALIDRMKTKTIQESFDMGKLRDKEYQILINGSIKQLTVSYIAEDLNITKNVVYSRLRTMTPQKAYDLGGSKSMKNKIKRYEIKVEGEIKNLTISEISSILGITKSSFRDRMKNRTPQEAFDMKDIENRSQKFNILIDGVQESKTIKEISKILNITEGAFRSRMKNKTPQEAFDFGGNFYGQERYEFVYLDVEYKLNSLKQVSKETGISNTTLSRKLKKEKNIQKAIDQILKDKESKLYSLEIDGIKYEGLNIREISKLTNVGESVISSRLLDGESIHKAIEKRSKSNSYNVKINDISHEKITLKEIEELTGIEARLIYKRLKESNMSIQEAVDFNYKFKAFNLHSSGVQFFAKKFNLPSLNHQYKKLKLLMPLEEIIIYRKLKQKEPEICIDRNLGAFVLLSDFCDDRGLDFKETLEKLKNGTNISDINN